jgi:AcrR family transcriptional regulator
MQRLAEALGVGTTTLYGYFRSKDELLDAVVDAAAAEYPLPQLGGDWKEQLRTIMATLRDELLGHPAVVHVRLTRPIVTAEGIRRLEAGIRVLRAAGFTNTLAAQAYRSLFLYTFAFATFNALGTASPEIRTALAALPPDEYPAIWDTLHDIVATYADNQFDHGLDALLDGLEVKLRS